MDVTKDKESYEEVMKAVIKKLPQYQFERSMASDPYQIYYSCPDPDICYNSFGFNHTNFEKAIYIGKDKKVYHISLSSIDTADTIVAKILNILAPKSFLEDIKEYYRIMEAVIKKLPQYQFKRELSNSYPNYYYCCTSPYICYNSFSFSKPNFKKAIHIKRDHKDYYIDFDRTDTVDTIVAQIQKKMDAKEGQESIEQLQRELEIEKKRVENEIKSLKKKLDDEIESVKEQTQKVETKSTKEEIICPTCKKENPDNANYCCNCRADLKKSFKFTFTKPRWTLKREQPLEVTQYLISDLDLPECKDCKYFGWNWFREIAYCKKHNKYRLDSLYVSACDDYEGSIIQCSTCKVWHKSKQCPVCKTKR